MNSLEFKNFKLHTNSTLKNMTKDGLIRYIHTLHHNWSVADEQLCNAIEVNKKWDKALDEACRLIEEDRETIDDWKDYEEYSSWKEWCLRDVD